MRVFNVRLAAILLGITVVLGVGVYALHYFQVHRFASFFLVESQQAEQRAAAAEKERDAALEEKSMKDAIRYLNSYIGLMPNDYKALEHLGILLADKAQPQAGAKFEWQAFMLAYGTLEKTVRLDPERIVARQRLVKMAMMIHRYQDARAHLEKYLLVDSPNDPDLLEQLAECQKGLRQFDQARDSLKKAIESHPAQVTAYDALAQLLRDRLSSPKEAEHYMEKMVKANPKSSKAHYLRAVYLVHPPLQLIDEALQEACKAKELAPDDTDVLLLVARCNMAKKKYDNARDCLARGIKLQPTDARMYIAMSQLESSAGNQDKAIAVLQQGIKATNQNPDLLWLMANKLIDTNKLDEARRIVDGLRKKEVPRPLIDYMDARIELVQSHWKNALERLNNVRGSLVLDPKYEQYVNVKEIDYWLAVCYRGLGDSDQQEQALRRVLAVDPSNVAARKGLAEIARAKGDYRGTFAELLAREKNGKLDPAGRLQLAQLRFATIIQQNAARRDWKPLEKLLAESLPDSAEVPLMRANLLSAQGHNDDAEKLLLKACKKYPKQIAPWNGLVRMGVHDKDWDKVEALLAEADKALGDSAELRLLRAQYFMLRGGVGVGDHLAKLAGNTEQFSDDQCVQLWVGLVPAFLEIGDRKQADLLAKKIEEKRPNNVQIRYFRFEQAVAAEDPAAVEQALKEIEAVAGRDYYWLYGQAVLLCLQTKKEEEAGPALEKALDYLKKARELRKDWSQIPKVEGSIYAQQGKTNLALPAFMEAIELGERSPAIVQLAVQLLFQLQRYADADKLLRRLESEQRSFPAKLRQIAAVCAMNVKDIPRAIEETRKAVPADSKDASDLVWFGQMLGVFGRQAKDRGQTEQTVELLGDAEKALRRAVELEPTLHIAWRALVQYYALMGSQDQAEATIEDLKTHVSEKDLPSTLAYCYEIIKNFDAAQEQYNAMLKAAPQDFGVVRQAVDFYRRAARPEPAKALLQGILDGKRQANASEVAWSRRELAKFLGLVIGGTFADHKKAISLVDQNLASPQATVADRQLDRQLLARLLASDLRRSEHDKAIEILESLGTYALPDDRFVLAQLYLKGGNWIKASELLRNLVAINDREPQYLEYYIDELLKPKHKGMSSARTYIECLERLTPNSFGTVSRKADLLFADNKWAEAFALLKEFVDNVDAEPHDRGLRLRKVAEKLAQLAAQLTKPEQASAAAQAIELAESLFRSFVRENPGQELVLAVFLGQHGKIDEALGILDESLQVCTIEQFHQACSLILGSGKATKDQLQRMNKIAQSAEVKFERVPHLLLAMADLRTHQELYSEAADLYREILKKEPDEPRALNNLAVLQALQKIKLEESLKLVNRALEIAGPLGSILDSRATVHLAMNNAEKAIADMNDAIAEQDSPDPVRLFHRAQAYELAGDKAKAKTDLDAALEDGLSKESLQLLEVPAFEKLRGSLQ